MNILIVEDDPLSLMLIVEFLRSKKLKCTPCRNGLEARALLEKHPFDILITDIIMPEVDGIELTKSIKQSGAPITPYIIAMSSGGPSIPQKIALSAAELYTDDILEKPISRYDLMRALVHAKQKLTCPSIKTINGENNDFDILEKNTAG